MPAFNILKTVLLAGCVPALSFPIAAAAQEAPPQAALDTKTGPDTKTGVEDIIVTAQRRSENLQSVPISVSAFNADALRNRNVTSTADLMSVTPGVQIGSGSIQRNELYIRGIGSNRFDAGGEASSGLFIDDVYQSRFSSLLMDLLDVERVEVLKGPQGTLYGRNTIGGAVAIYTPTPGKDLHVSARADAGSKNLAGGQISLSGPLSDTLAIGASFGYRQRDGFMRDSVSGRTNGTQSYGGRLKLAYTPTDRLKILLTGGAFQTDQDAVIFDRPTADIFFGRPGLFIAPDTDRYSEAYNSLTGAHSRIYQVSGRIDYEGQDVQLTSITAYQNTRDDTADDQDTSPASAFSYTQTGISKTFSQEFRISSARNGGLSLDGRLKWLVGLYYFQENGSERTNFAYGPDSISVFLAGLNGIAVPNNTAYNLIGKDLTVKSYAVFGQATYKVTDALNLTVGGRYTHDKKFFNIFGTTTLPGFPLVDADFVTPVGKGWSKFTPKVAIDYTVAPDVMLYGSYAKGYKSGASQSAVFNPILAARLVDPETVQTYEIGIKSQFLDRRIRLNVAGYTSQFKDLQVRRLVSPAPGLPTQPVLDNAASSSIKGVEVEANIVPVDGVHLDIGYNYLDAHYGTFVPQPGTDYSGNRMPRAPKHTLTIAARYELKLANNGTVVVGAQGFVSSRIYFQPDNLPSQSQGSYGTVDANLGYRLPGGRWAVTAWVKNALDREYLTYLEPQTPAVRQSWSDRRSVGVTLTYRQ